eukprot:6969728-Ditylum_brightwellii.AAC.1
MSPNKGKILTFQVPHAVTLQTRIPVLISSTKTTTLKNNGDDSDDDMLPLLDCSTYDSDDDYDSDCDMPPLLDCSNYNSDNDSDDYEGKIKTSAR